MVLIMVLAMVLVMARAVTLSSMLHTAKLTPSKGASLPPAFSSRSDSSAQRTALALALVCLLALLAPVCSAEPQHWPLWEAYRQRFIDDQGRVIDHSAGDRTTSEGQAYAMFFSLAANDRARFDRLLGWTQANLAQGDLTAHLPAWEWGKNSAGEWKAIDSNSAADADLWMAYTLLEAGRLWHEPRFAGLGRTMAQRIAKEEVIDMTGVGTVLLPGPHGFQPGKDRSILNPSYLPLPLLARLAGALPHGPWTRLQGSLRKLVGSSAGQGFAMDWVEAGADGVHPALPPAQAASGRRQAQPAGSYDAIRVYLWLGLTDPRTPGRGTLLASLPGMAAYLRTAVTPPLEVDQAGKVTRPEGPVGFSAAVIPYLEALGDKAEAAKQSDRLAALWDGGSGLYGKTPDYYDQNLILFSTGWSAQRYRFERDGRLRVQWR